MLGRLRRAREDARGAPKGRLCARAQASVERTYSPDRYQAPQRRNAAGPLEAASWDEALAQVAAAIRENPSRTRVLGGDPGDTAAVVPFYENKGLVRRVDGIGPLDEVFARLANAIDGA